MEKKYSFENIYVALPSQIDKDNKMIVQHPKNITVVELTEENKIVDLKTNEEIYFMKDANYELDKKYVGVFKNDLVHFYTHLNMLKTDFIDDISMYVDLIKKFKEEYDKEYFEELYEFLKKEILNFETVKTQKLTKMERKIKKRTRKKQ